jgi:hypothetical protein
MTFVALNYEDGPFELDDLGTEYWVPVPGWEDLYEVSSHGGVSSKDRWMNHRSGGKVLRRGRVLSPGKTSSGYLTVSLCRNGCRKTYTVHQLVMEAFVGPRPRGLQVAHNDGDKLNNSVKNLRYCTQAENEADKVLHGTDTRGERSGTAKLTEEEALEIYHRSRAGDRNVDLATEFGVSKAAICEIKSGRNWAWLTGHNVH